MVLLFSEEVDGPSAVGEVPAPTENEDYKFECNGCGPKGMQVSENFGLYKCCNGHDLCYATCGTSKDYCENVFKKCMTDVCKSKYGHDPDVKAECDKQAQSMTGLTAAFGGGFHHRSQQGDAEKGIPAACDCYQGQEAADERWMEKFTEFYMAHADPPMKEEEAATKAAEVMKKNTGKKRGEAYYKMIKKYQKSTKETEFIWDNVKAEL